MSDSTSLRGRTGWILFIVASFRPGHLDWNKIEMKGEGEGESEPSKQKEFLLPSPLQSHSFPFAQSREKGTQSLESDLP